MEERIINKIPPFLKAKQELRHHDNYNVYYDEYKRTGDSQYIFTEEDYERIKEELIDFSKKPIMYRALCGWFPNDPDGDASFWKDLIINEKFLKGESYTTEEVGIGHHWTRDLEYAKKHCDVWENTGLGALLTSEINPEDIDFLKAFKENFYYPDEKEIFVRNGTELHLIKACYRTGKSDFNCIRLDDSIIVNIDSDL